MCQLHLKLHDFVLMGKVRRIDCANEKHGCLGFVREAGAKCRDCKRQEINTCEVCLEDKANVIGHKCPACRKGFKHREVCEVCGVHQVVLETPPRASETTLVCTECRPIFRLEVLQEATLRIPRATAESRAALSAEGAASGSVDIFILATKPCLFVFLRLYVMQCMGLIVCPLGPASTPAEARAILARIPGRPVVLVGFDAPFSGVGPMVRFWLGPSISQRRNLGGFNLQQFMERPKSMQKTTIGKLAEKFVSLAMGETLASVRKRKPCVSFEGYGWLLYPRAPMG